MSWASVTAISEFTSLNAAYEVNPIFYHAMNKV